MPRYLVVSASRTWEAGSDMEARAEAFKAAKHGQVWSRLETRLDGEWVVYAGGIDPEDLGDDDEWEEVAGECAAIRYAADGHHREQDPTAPSLSDGAVLVTGTLEECRAAIARVLRSQDPSLDDRAIASRRWTGGEEDIEAYHEADWQGCGGWVIQQV